MQNQLAFSFQLSAFWTFEELFRVDIGEQINAELGKHFFSAGELMQFVGMFAGLKIWIFRDSSNDWFKVAFGETPAPFGECEWVSRDEAIALVMAKTMEVCDV